MVRLIIISDFTEIYATRLLKGILAYSRETEPWVICRMPTTFMQQHGVQAVADWAVRWGADAVIGQFNPDDPVDLFSQRGIVVIAQDYKHRFTTIPNITGDYYNQGRQAAQFFVSRGFRHFAFYGYEDVVWSEERWKGFSDTLLEKGFSGQVSDYRKQSLDNLWYYALKPLSDWLLSLPHPTALLACDDTRANVIIEACRAAGLHVPKDVAVMGVDNDEVICQLSFPELSSISTDVFHAGYETAAYIDSLLKGKTREVKDIEVPYMAIVERMSTEIFATDNPNILRVLEFIHSHLSSALDTPTLLRLVPLSRRLLEKQFKAATGLSIHKYVTDVRIRHFAQLLITTDEDIDELAFLTGLSSAKNLSRQFRARMGMTPLAYRQAYRL